MPLCTFLTSTICANGGRPTHEHHLRQGNRAATGPEATTPEIERPCFKVYDHPQTMSNGKKLRAGVYWHGQRQGRGDSTPAPFDQWICSPLHVEAITSSNGSQFGRLVRFRNTLGQVREWAMPMAMLSGSGEDLRRELLSMGVEIDPDGFKSLNRYIQSQHPKRQVTAASSTGWYSDALFIMQGRTSARATRSCKAKRPTWKTSPKPAPWTAGARVWRASPMATRC